MLGFAQGSFGVLDHHILFALSVGFIGDGFPSRRLDGITGRTRRSKYKVEGQTHYSVDLIADSFAILAKAKVKTVEDDMQD